MRSIIPLPFLSLAACSQEPAEPSLSDRAPLPGGRDRLCIAGEPALEAA